MNGVNAVLMSDARAFLVRKVNELSERRSIDEVFTAWLLPHENLGLEPPEKAAAEAATHTGAARSYQDVAVLGFRADIGTNQPQIEALEHGLLWLSGRPCSLNETPTGVTVDAIAVLGVALGARSLGNHQTRELISEWLASFIFTSYEMRDTESWQKCLYVAAQRVAELKPDLTVPNDDSVADVCLALTAKGLIESKDSEDLALKAIHYLKTMAGNPAELGRIALSLAAHNALNSPIFAGGAAAKEQAPMTKLSDDRKIKILFLAADPINEVRLRLSEEVREIDSKLRQSAYPDRFVIEQQWAVRIADLQSHLLRHEPDIVHFSGHGSAKSEIILEDSNGNSQAVPVRALKDLFSTLKDNIRCVVLNACYSEAQAAAIAGNIDCVVGMSKTINDQAAISFAASFYQALAYGRSVEDAYKLGCNQIHMENLNDEDVPRLLAPNANPHDIVFVVRT